MRFLDTKNISNEVLDTVGAAILVLDSEGRIIVFNKAAETLSGYSFAEIEHLTPWDVFILPEESAEVQKVFSNLTSGHFPNTHTNYWLTKSGDRKLIEWSNTAIANDDGTVEYVIATGIDVTKKAAAEAKIAQHLRDLETIVEKRTIDLAKANQELDKLATIDGLTNIFNRRCFDEVLTKEVNRAKRSGTPLSLILCDVDHFKRFNDRYGHVAGDSCLVTIASKLRKFFSRASDLVARYGGEEFAIILPNIDREKSVGLAEELVNTIRLLQIPFDNEGSNGIVTLSAGVATLRGLGLTNPLALLKAADTALYEAKRKGRNCVIQYRQRSLQAAPIN